MPQYTFDVNAAIKAGYTPDQIQQYLDQQQAKGNQYNLTPTPQATPQQSQQPKPNDNFIVNNLPTIGAIAAPIISDVVTGGTALPADMAISGAGAAAGEGLKEFLQGGKLNPRSIALQGGLGAAGTGVGGVVSKVAGKFLPDLAEGAAGRIMNTVYKQPIKATKAAVAGGETLGEEALARGQVGTTKQLLDTATTQIQAAEDALQQKLLGSDAKVSMDAVRKSVQPLIDKYTQSGNTAAADALSQRLASIEAANGSSMPVAAANQIKRTLYDEVNNAYGAQSTPGIEGVKAVAKGLKEEIGKVPGVSQLNKDLSFFGQQRNAMIDKLARGGRNNAVGLTDAILAGGGGTVAGIPGAVAVPLARHALGSDLAKTATAQVLSKAANSSVLAKAGNLGAQIAGQTIVRGTLPSSPTGVNFGTEQSNQTGNNQQNPNQSNTLPSSPSQAFGNNSTMNNSQSQGLPAGIQPAQPPANFMAGYTINGNPISDADKNMIYQIVNYRLDPTKMTSLRNNERERIINLASQYDPTYDSSQFAVKQKLRNDYTSGTQAKTINSLNTAIGHLYTLKQAANALGNGQLPILNSGKNAINQGLGGAKVNNFNTAASAVSAEMATVFKNSGATDDEIRQWRASLNPNMSPAQLQGSIDEMIQLMGSRLQSLQNQYEQGLGVPADFSFLSPESKMILQSLEQNQGGQLPATP